MPVNSGDYFVLNYREIVYFEGRVQRFGFRRSVRKNSKGRQVQVRRGSGRRSESGSLRCELK